MIRVMSRRRVDAFAQLLSEGHRLFEIQAALGMTKGEASSTMRRIRKDLGRQAA